MRRGDTGNEYSSGDKQDLRLPPCQQKLLDAVIATGKPVVVVLSSGSALAVDQGNAILQAWYPGQAGGAALARVLFGEVSPGGRLPVTFYRGVEDLPAFEDYAMTNRTYRYYRGEALFPFGYGLSYTHFGYSDARFENGVLSVTVRNLGAVDADEVVQAYVKDHDSPFAVRNHSLCAFRRVPLRAGESARVTLPVSERAFATIDDAGQPTHTSKHFTLFIGGSQPDERSVMLTGSRPLAVEVRLAGT